MGTRATVKFYNSKPTEESKPLFNVYFQFDGYYEGVGHELADFLISKKLINGINNQTMEQGFANGMGCLSAQYIKEIKTEIGGVYLHSIDDEEQYDYKVYPTEEGFIIAVDAFEGTPEEFKNHTEDED